MVRDYPKDTEDNMLMFLVKQADKEDIFFPYNFNFHFILLIIDLHKGDVKVMDSKRKEHAEWANMAALLQRAWKRFINTVPGEWKPELTFNDYPCMRQEPGNNLCGYYVCDFIRQMACHRDVGDAIHHTRHQLELSYAALLCPVRMLLGTYRLAGGCWEDIGVEQREDA
nr:uncharacterized protein LOC127340438 [Lolium perenne]